MKKLTLKNPRLRAFCLSFCDGWLDTHRHRVYGIVDIPLTTYQIGENMNEIQADALAIKMAAKAIDSDFKTLTGGNGGRVAAIKIAEFIKTLSEELKENVSDSVLNNVIDKP